MIFFRFYRNSVLASVVSILGSFALIGGGALIGIGGTGGIIGGILVIAASIGLMIWGKIISRNKANKVWWDQTLTKVSPVQIIGNVNLAIQIYNANPVNWTLKKIEELNPVAAQLIRQNQVKK